MIHDDVWNAPAKTTIEGTGDLVCNDQTRISSRVWMAQLWNGRLVARIQPDNFRGLSSSKNVEQWLNRCRPFDLVGTLDNHYQFTARGLDIVNTRLGGNLGDNLVFEGFIQYPGDIEITVPDKGEVLAKRVSYEVTNLRLYTRTSPIDISIGQRQVQISSLAKNNTVALVASSLKTSGIYTRIGIEPASQESEQHEMPFLHSLCSLLGFVERAHVWPVTQQWYDEHNTLVKCRYQEPVFFYPVLRRPLIPPDQLGHFVQTTLPVYSSHESQWKLEFVQDYYIQAMSLRSAWPQAVGFFTALETLKDAFLHRSENAGLEHYVSSEEFKKQHVPSRVVELLEESFEVFKNLPQEERQSLTGKMGELNRRAYKVILRRMFERLHVSVSDDELAAIVALRNAIIHTGTPKTDSPNAWLWATKCAGLVERLILRGILAYQGEFEAYDQAFSHPEVE